MINIIKKDNFRKENIMQTQNETKQELFGGALNVTLGTQWSDMSNRVPIPDNQEVFQDMTEAADANSGQLIVEILEISNDVANDKAAEYIFDDLAQANKSQKTEVSIVRRLLLPVDFEQMPAYVDVG